MFRDRSLPEECARQTVVPLPKKNGGSREIGPVEVLRKTESGILNRRLTSVIVYHDIPRGFQAGRGTGTASLEAKLLRQLAAMREEALYEIFLDIHKAYNALD